LILCAVAISATFQASASIPTASTILGRYTHNNGKSAYIIEQEVQFQTEVDQFVLREKWMIEGPGSMYLIVNNDQSGAGAAHMEVLYHDGRRVYFDNAGTVKSAGLSTEFLEPFMFYRTARGLLEALQMAKILPSNFGIEKQRIGKIENYKPQPENLVQLSRSGGVITYQFGELTPPNVEKLNPGFWVDQDAFSFRRMRFPSQAEVVADKHAQFAGGLHLPRERTINWDNHSALIRVLSVKILPKSSRAWFSTNYLTGHAGPSQALKLPASQQVTEFYSRFR
jgi:hypothetical protein